MCVCVRERERERKKVIVNVKKIARVRKRGIILKKYQNTASKIFQGLICTIDRFELYL